MTRLFKPSLLPDFPIFVKSAGPNEAAGDVLNNNVSSFSLYDVNDFDVYEELHYHLFFNIQRTEENLLHSDVFIRSDC